MVLPEDRAVVYTVKEIFKTLQGEGAQAGRAAVFLSLQRLQSVVRPRARPRCRSLSVLRH